MMQWLQNIYGVESWNAETAALMVGTDLMGERVGELQFLDFDLAETWMVQILPQVPVLPQRLGVTATFHTAADEIHAQPQMSANTHNFQGTASWFEVGTQILAASGWRPDCALETKANVAKPLPPKNTKELIVIEPSVNMRHSCP